MRKQVLFAGAVSLLLSVSAIAKTPTGEVAKYELDRSGERTSRIIKKGSLVLTGGAFTPKEGTKGTFEVTLAYDLKVLFAGRMKGKKSFQVPSEFFTPEFMERLRKEGEIDQDIFKLRHLAIEDVETKFGVRYASCDKVRAYDVKMDKAPKFESLMNETFAEAYLAQVEEPFPNFAAAENVEVIFYISPTIPVLGGVKFDASGVVRGMNIKAGFDYMPVSGGKDLGSKQQ